jgi:glycerophosphoryl diester phosphodiesterase
METFLRHKYAHRGLHDGEHAENSLSAFGRAVEHGFGIELDVHVSRDGEVVVFHDKSLKRMCGVEGEISDYTAEELSHLSLAGTGEGIPTLREVLALVDGRVPLLVEIKAMTVADKEVTERTAALLAEYRGPYMIESFNPLSLREIRRLAPGTMRGFLGSHLTKGKKWNLAQYLTQHFLFNCIVRPDFIAFDKNYVTYVPFAFFRLCHIHRPLIAWNIRSAEEEELARRQGFDTVIFEGYVPEERTSTPIHHDPHDRHRHARADKGV